MSSIALEQYIAWEPNAETKAEAQALLDSGDSAGIDKACGGRIAFGTAGLRGPMAAGYKNMNDLVILQTVQGLCMYLKAQNVTSNKVVIGYDHRCKGSITSTNFAQLSSAVFLHFGFEVLLLDGTASGSYAATPFVPFAIKHHACCAGIMVTASHNPKADNGFKVYWGNGCQIIPPHDDGIAAAIMDNLEPVTQYKYSGVDWASTAEAAAATGKLQTGAAVLEALVSAYMTAISSLRFDGAAAAAVGADAVMATYTAMHGVGRPWVERAVQTFGIPRDSVSVVAVQADPDPEFPTVVFPNPEEKGALNCAQEWAVQHDCGLIVANDPDADRLAVAEFQKGDGKWHVFHGNEIGAMLGYWAIKKYLKAGGAAGEAAVIASVVSSRMLRAIARKEGIQYYDTLTGFKWIGNKAVELAGSGTSVLFGYEEALGYAYGDVVFDKDGVSAAAVLLEMAAVLRKNDDRGLLQQLNYLRAQYGDFVSYNYYIICHDGIVTDTCFADMRTGGADGGYKLAFAGVKVTSIQDVTMGYDSTTSDNKLDMPATPGSHMVMYEFENGVSFTLRTSGTEPKIKWYTEVAAKAGAPRDTATNDLKAFVDAAIQEMLQCEKYGLK